MHRSVAIITKRGAHEDVRVRGKRSSGVSRADEKGRAKSPKEAEQRRGRKDEEEEKHNVASTVYAGH